MRKLMKVTLISILLLVLFTSCERQDREDNSVDDDVIIESIIIPKLDGFTLVEVLGNTAIYLTENGNTVQVTVLLSSGNSLIKASGDIKKKDNIIYNEKFIQKHIGDYSIIGVRGTWPLVRDSYSIY